MRGLETDDDDWVSITPHTKDTKEVGRGDCKSIHQRNLYLGTI